MKLVKENLDDFENEDFEDNSEDEYPMFDYDLIIQEVQDLAREYNSEVDIDFKDLSGRMFHAQEEEYELLVMQFEDNGKIIKIMHDTAGDEEWVIKCDDRSEVLEDSCDDEENGDV